MHGVRKTYETASGAYLALDGIDLSIGRGEFFCLLGPSGCGKSTLLSLLAGFEQPTQGRLHFDGTPISGAGRERVVLFQDANSALLPWLSVEENIRFALRLRRVARGQWDAITTQVLTMVDLDAHRTKFPSQLSGGMRQRLQIARGLAVDPAVLLMDEPFAALDALTRRRMHTVLLDIWQRTGKTIVFVTHDIAEAVLLADRIGILSVGPASKLYRVIDIEQPRPRNLTAPEIAARVSEIEGLLAPEVERAEARAGETAGGTAQASSHA